VRARELLCCAAQARGHCHACLFPCHCHCHCRRLAARLTSWSAFPPGSRGGGLMKNAVSFCWLPPQMFAHCILYTGIVWCLHIRHGNQCTRELMPADMSLHAWWCQPTGWWSNVPTGTCPCINHAWLSTANIHITSKATMAGQARYKRSLIIDLAYMYS